MASLKADLDEYMLMNEEKKSSSYKLPSFNVKIPFVGSNSNGSAGSSSNSWLNDDNDDSWCMPKLNRFQRIVAAVICIGLGVFCLVLSTFYIPVSHF
jgi:hypothetical protein